MPLTLLQSLSLPDPYLAFFSLAPSWSSASYREATRRPHRSRHIGVGNQDDMITQLGLGNSPCQHHSCDLGSENLLGPCSTPGPAWLTFHQQHRPHSQHLQFPEACGQGCSLCHPCSFSGSPKPGPSLLKGRSCAGTCRLLR